MSAELLGVSRSAAPEVATTRVMARTLATFYAFGGTAGVCITSAAEPGNRRLVLLILSLVALLAAAGVGRWGARWPRSLFHGAVGVATALIVTAVLVAPDPVTSFAAATLIAFVVVDAHFFFSGRQALAHLVVAVAGVTAALLVSDGVPLGATLGLDLVLTGIGIVIHRLVVLASSASIDPLTGLSNRRGFDQALDELMSEAARVRGVLSAVLIDVDHFKSVNDTHGHEAGDRVLCRVADVWRHELPAGAMFARHGGDEFSLLLPGMPGPEALALVRRICALHPDVSLSCGVAQYRSGDSASQLMRSADRALYDAKIRGRGRAQLFTGGRNTRRSDGAVPV
ncbi:GGDEF domain-containing protein [Blastococcus saxobsidens]|uniref:Diguanylate cyclase (GGDEF)-like protein n=1 Tax=Blastococcus saxobsidens TaxID=138336 RepID=A0A4Q7Y8K0_9ACTN|nr:GGDEF domain-containing protein [Blastococcus saxobsidens]RZU32461.1 diguanylate cyclase (GGDEF)-like protein [Blastococcus saxobsidens]